MKKWKK